MLKSFFQKNELIIRKDDVLNDFYNILKQVYCYDSISDDRKKYLSNIMEEYGYLNFPHVKALEELSPAETLFCLEYKWQNNGVFVGNRFLFENENISVLKRNNIASSDWICAEGHEIKLINLPALSNGNSTKECSKLIDWLKQLLILPTGNMKYKILDTTIYLIPFHPRDFGCAYLPQSLEASCSIYDNLLGEKTGLNVTEQVKIFIQMAQLAGHPVIYDILPQISRFSKIILLKPFMARWFDANKLISQIKPQVDIVAQKFSDKYLKTDIDVVKNLYKEMLLSGEGNLSEHYRAIYDDFDNELLPFKKEISNAMAEKKYQSKIHKKVSKIVAKVHNTSPAKLLKEEDLTLYTDAVQTLIKENLWPLPGGAWCSSGIPIFDKMAECSAYPLFRHFNIKGEDVTEFANLDCQTPYYFTYLESGKYNKKVINEYIEQLKIIRNDFNYDGFRVDHVDHIVDDISERDGLPISYRIPAKVLAKVNKAMKDEIPYFATLAEYMLWDDFYKEYHLDMHFDVLWGNDIVCQSDKTPSVIIEDNQKLANFNVPLFNSSKLSILKTYNNQDGEFASIDRFPSQLGECGAMFKWFKYKFLPGGKFATRPIMYVDGDESFTPTGIEETIGSEVPMKRGKNYYFYAKFDAISRFVKSQEIIVSGEAQIVDQDDEGFATWIITKEPLKKAFLIVSNYKSPFEKFTRTTNEGSDYTEVEIGKDIYNKTVKIPCDYSAIAEYVFDGRDFAYVEFASPEDSLTFPTLYPGEFKIFLIKK